RRHVERARSPERIAELLLVPGRDRRVVARDEHEDPARVAVLREQERVVDERLAEALLELGGVDLLLREARLLVVLDAALVGLHDDAREVAASEREDRRVDARLDRGE